MTEADIPFAIRATDLEGWGYSRADFERLLHLDPGGCFKAVVGGKRAGITTATSYGRVGWIGNVVVLPRYRGRGVGSQLVQAGIAYLERKGADTVRLNSYIRTVRFYERLGFKGEFENVRFKGILEPDGSGGNVFGIAPLRSVAAFDQFYFGASRFRLLSSLRREFPGTFLTLDDDGLIGFLVGQVSNGTCEIAPWVSDPNRPVYATTLWRVLSNRLAGGRIAFTAPSVSKQALSLARRAHLKRSFMTLQMYHGRKAHGGRPEGIVALGGLEKG